MLGYLILSFITVPLVELAILIKVGQHIGVFNTVSIVITTGIIGALLAKSEGLKTISGIQRDLNMGIIPSERLIDGLFIFAGGLLLLTPGLITDLAGFVFLIPYTRYHAKKWLQYKFRRMLDRG
ncbi:MAG: membrane protein FxsA [Candidatus Omnitrophica bacterium]|nr:membrane protein FxsA [Candidatus Omnitrophota bacterium]